MKKIASTVVQWIIYACVAYALFFFLWILLMFACTSQNDVNTCNDNTMSRVAHVLYGPLFK